MFYRGGGSVLVNLTRKCVRWMKEYFRNIVKTLNSNRSAGDTFACLVLFIGFVVWGIALGIQSYRKGLVDVLLDENFAKSSIRLWIYYYSIVVIVGVIYESFTKEKRMFLNAGGRTVVLVPLAVTIAVLIEHLPSLPLILIPIVCVFAVVKLVQTIFKKRPPTVNEDGTVDSGNNHIYYSGVLVLLVSFLGIPLMIILIATVIFSDGAKGIAQNPTSFTAWQYFFHEAERIAEELLALLT